MFCGLHKRQSHDVCCSSSALCTHSRTKSSCHTLSNLSNSSAYFQKFACTMSILASCGASVKFHCWPSGVYLGNYEVGDDNLCVRNISWCKTGEHIVAVPSNGIPVVIRPPEGNTFTCPNTATLTCEIAGVSKVNVADFSRTVATAVALGTHDGEVYVYDLKQRHVVNRFPSLPQEVKFLQFSRQDLLLAAGSANGQIILYNSKSIVCASFMVPSSFSLSAMSFHQNNSYLLASGSREGIVCIWNTDSGNAILSGQHHDHIVSDVAFYPMGQIFASVGVDQKFICHDLRTPKFIHCCVLERELAAVAFMPDGDELAIASSDGHLFCYDRRNLQVPVLTVVAHKKQIKKIAFQRGNPNPYYNEEELKASQSMSKVVETPSMKVLENRTPKGMEMYITNSFQGDTEQQQILRMAEMQDAKNDLLEQMKIKCKVFESQMDDCFFKMRIDISKLFIGLEEQLERNKDAFINLLMTNSKSSANKRCRVSATHPDSPQSSSTMCKKKSSSKRDMNKN